jgi:protease-4
MSNPYGPGANPNPPQTVYVQVPAQKSPGVLSRLFTFVQWLFFLFIAIVVIAAVVAPDALVDDPENKVDERYYALDKEGTQKVAIIEITGTIDSAEQVRKECHKVQHDSAVKAVVLRVESPGGMVTASDQMYHYLREMVTKRKIPLVVSMGGIAASGGYYVSMACGDEKDVIYAEPTTWTGSIGVMIPHYTVAGLMEKLAIEDDTLKSAPLKTVGSPTKKMTPEERAVLQGLVDDSFTRFKQIVEAGRPKLRGDKATMDKATTGEVFTSDRALELGLVDKIGFLEDAIDRAVELAHLDRDKTKVVKYHKPKSLADVLVGMRAPARGAIDLRQLLDMTTPRAYYLFAWPQPAE